MACRTPPEVVTLRLPMGVPLRAVLHVSGTPPDASHVLRPASSVDGRLPLGGTAAE